MNPKSKTYRSNGKLLITSEYLVLDGAKALALPTKYGQSLTISPNDSGNITWKSYNELSEIWFEDVFEIQNNEILKHVKNDNTVSSRLIQILKAVQNLNPKFLKKNQGINITTHQDFNRLWGLGTSSTLINNVAQWAKVDAYKLLEKTFGGSGYDIACAQNNTPITYQLRDKKSPNVNTVSFNPTFKNQLYFVYLNKKQNSRDGIANYRESTTINKDSISAINNITEAIINAETLKEFKALILKHEEIIGNCIQQKTIQSQLFNDFNGVVKSLGAWGGDFVLVISEENPSEYFKHKGFKTIIPFEEMVF